MEEENAFHKIVTGIWKEYPITLGAILVVHLVMALVDYIWSRMTSDSGGDPEGLSEDIELEPFNANQSNPGNTIVQ